MSALKFVLQNSFYSGRLPGLIAGYLSFLVLGFTPVALIFFKSIYFQTLSLASRNMFLLANLFYIGCIVTRISYDIYICLRASKFTNKQANISHNVFLEVQRQKKASNQKAYLNDKKNPKEFSGDHILDNTLTLYQSMNTFVQSTLQSCFSVLSTMITVYMLGYGRLGVLACCIAGSIIYFNLILQKRWVTEQQKKVKNLKAKSRNNIQTRFENNQSPTQQDSEQLNQYLAESNRLLNYDAIRNWTYIFIKYTSESLIMLCAVLLLTTSFPLERNIIAGSVMSATLLFNVAGVLASTIMDSSTVIRDFDKLADATSSYQNVRSQITAQLRDVNTFAAYHASVLAKDFGKNYSPWSIMCRDLQKSISNTLSCLFLILSIVSLLVQTGLVVQSLPFGMRFGQHVMWSLISGVFTKTTKKLPDRQQSYQNDRLFFGLTVAVIITMGLRATLSPSLQSLSLAFFTSSVGATSIATRLLMPQKLLINGSTTSYHSDSVKPKVKAIKMLKQQNISEINEENISSNELGKYPN